METGKNNTCRKDSTFGSNSGEIFSFPSTQNPDSDFEFGCLTPDSPSQDPCRNSPADHLFLNGRLLPHSFLPSPQQQQSNNIFPASNVAVDHNISRPLTARSSSSSSSSSKEYSLQSSRSSSSSSSRNSTCSSGRTSCSSDGSERRLLYNNHKYKNGGVYYKRITYNMRSTKASKIVTAQLYGSSSQRWQHITPMAAALKRDASRRKSGGGGGVVVKEEEVNTRSERKDGKDGGGDDINGESEKKQKKKMKKMKMKKKKKKKMGICRRFFMTFWFACRVCHAMEPSAGKD